MWVVGASENINRRWSIRGVEISTGTATVRFKRTVSGATQYLQSNGTFSTSPNTFAMTFTSGRGWDYYFTVPASMEGYNIVAEATHSLHPKILPEEHFVEESGFVNPGATVR